MTQPLDVIKTRMQSLEARREYKNSFVCAARIFRDEGILTFWSGAVPRLARLVLSGGIVFTMYVHLCFPVLSVFRKGGGWFSSARERREREVLVANVVLTR